MARHRGHGASARGARLMHCVCINDSWANVTRVPPAGLPIGARQLGRKVPWNLVAKGGIEPPTQGFSVVARPLGNQQQHAATAKSTAKNLARAVANRQLSPPNVCHCPKIVPCPGAGRLRHVQALTSSLPQRDACILATNHSVVVKIHPYELGDPAKVDRPALPEF